MNDRPAALPPDIPAAADAGLKIFGILLILAGAACAGLFLLLVVAALLAPMSAEGMAVEPGMMIASGSTYLLLGAALVVLGIGSWRVRRWARPLILIMGWAGLITVLIGAVGAAFVLPQIVASDASGALSLGCVLAPMLFTLAIMLAFPLALIVYYRRPAVAALFDRRDPGPAWTDRTPTVLLGVAVLMWVGAIACLAGAVTYKALPMFGTVVSGWPLRMFFLALAAVSAWIGLAVYRRQVAGFWALVGLQVLGIANLFTMRGLDEKSLYEAMGYSPATAEQAARLGVLGNTTFLIAMGACWLILTLALFAVRKHFLAAAPSETAPAPPV